MCQPLFAVEALDFQSCIV
uniref:Uncharacterized protein n=1 Tax=Rhizophora mucronata TaxID=61149 RepID=A0A2P2QN10_RHIMU